MQLLPSVDFRVVKDIAPRSTGTLSASLDCTGYNRVRIWQQQVKTSGKAAKLVFLARSTPASALYSSATGTAITGTVMSAAALSATRGLGYDIDMAGLGPWITVKASCATASGNYGILAELTRGPVNPARNYNFTSTGLVGGTAGMNQIPASP